VNCTDNIPNFFEKKKKSPSKKSPSPTKKEVVDSKKTAANKESDEIKYLRFTISCYSRSVSDTDASTLKYLLPLFKFVDNSLRNGHNVMVHCLAGAHLAGTTGVMLIMRYTGINDVKIATKTAKHCRWVATMGELGAKRNVFSEERIAICFVAGARRRATTRSEATSNTVPCGAVLASIRSFS